jgi:hypothetical protein
MAAQTYFWIEVMFDLLQAIFILILLNYYNINNKH